MTDAERKRKRLVILKQIDQIAKLCKCDNYLIKHSCEHCEKLAPLGEQLIKLSKPRKSISSNGKLVLDARVRERPYKYTPKEFTVEQYVRAKVNGMTDRQFAKSMTMSGHTFGRWKKENVDEINRCHSQLMLRGKRKAL